MPKIIDVEITESESELLYLLRKQTKILQHSRVKTLLFIKQGKVKYTSEIATKLNRSRKSIYNWLQLYQNEGIQAYLEVASRGSRKEQLNDYTKECLATKLENPYTDITSYVELLQWAEQNCQEKIPYHALYHYCRSKLNSQLKIARKSHHKKDKQTVEVFKKTS